MLHPVFSTVAAISNDYHNLTPIGTINFYNLPTECDLLGVSQHGQWKWLDTDLLLARLKCTVNPLVYHLHFLVLRRYIMATYRIIDVFGLPVAKVRVYSIHDDVTGARFIHEWRKRTTVQQLRTTWEPLLQTLDFSPAGWLDHVSLLVLYRHVNDLKRDGTEVRIGGNYTNPSTNQIQTDIPPTSQIQTDIPPTSQLLSDTQQNQSTHKYSSLSVHFERWKKSSPPSLYSPVSDEHPLLRLQKIYNSVRPPDGTGLTLHQVPGIKSALYLFQLESVFTMHHKECQDTYSLLPNLHYVLTPFGDTFYFDLNNYVCLGKPAQYKLPKGGILAENMGLGKTVICLSLICLSKNECSKVPEDLLVHEEPIKITKMPSLVDVCVRAVNSNSLPWKSYVADLPETSMRLLEDNPGYFHIPLVNSYYESQYLLRVRNPSTRLNPVISYKSLLLCTTTLIIVPDNLFRQWSTELEKHIERGFLKVLFVSSNKRGLHAKTLPSSEELIKYDVVFITTTFLSKQDTSVLHEIYWKRLVIDEGHSASSKTSKASHLCRQIYSERRWAVTGTPTSGLTSLHMDQTGLESTQKRKKTEVNTEDKNNQHKNGQLSVNNDPILLKNGHVLDVSSSKSPSPAQYTIKEHFNEREDLIKLGNLMGNFLHIEPFHSQQKYWVQQVVKPFMNGESAADVAIQNLLDSVMIRHRDVDCLKLPRLRHDVVLLEPSFHNKLSVNLFTAVLAVNAVSSERKDVDFMFHPSNAQQLRRLVGNLQRSTVHWTGFKHSDVETLLSICNEYLEKKHYSPEDIKLLEKSAHTARMALANPRWESASLLHEMHYFVQGIPEAFIRALGTSKIDSKTDRVREIEKKGMDKMIKREITDSSDKVTGWDASVSYNGDIDNSHSPVKTEYGISNGSLTSKYGRPLSEPLGVFGAPQIHQIQDFFYKNRFLQYFQEKLATVVKSFWTSYWRDTVKKNAERLHVKTDMPEAQIIESKVEEATKPISEAPTSFEQMRACRILGTASSKLSYLGSRLLEHLHRGIKSLVFFEFEDNAYYLTELLDVLGVHYIMYATFISPTQRAQNLDEFTQFDGGVTLVMDLRLASHGLTIIAATHVYFISPVWHRAVEAQAIKRAHRIGQTKEVYVETLVLKGTLEEEIYRKRTNEVTDKYLTDNNDMREYILQHRFLDVDEQEQEWAPFRAKSMDENIVMTTTPDLYSLMAHQDKMVGDERHWDVYLFTETNLDKMMSKKWRLGEDKSEEKEHEKEHEKKHEKEHEKNPLLKIDSIRKRKGDAPEKRKKVRFG